MSNAQQSQAATQARQRVAHKPTDLSLSAKIEALVPDAKLYRDLQTVEQRIDATITRKRLDLQDALNRAMRRKKTMRIFVSNTAHDQPWQSNDQLEENAFDFETGAIPQWTLCIEGRLLEEEEEEEGRKFSSFFRQIVVEIDRPRDLYPESNFVEWHRARSAEAFDGFTVRRKGDLNVDVKITLVVDEYPDTYRLSPRLGRLLDLREETRPGIVMALWQYIRFHNLQDADERRLIHCDEALQHVFNTERLFFPRIPELINAHLLPPETTSFTYTVRVDKAKHMSATAYDVEVEIDDPTRQKMHDILTGIHNTGELSQLDESMALTVHAINSAKAKRDFLSSFALNPAEAINRWVESQSNDLHIILGDRDIAREDIRRSSFYAKPAIKESVFYVLNQRGIAQ